MSWNREFDHTKTLLLAAGGVLIFLVFIYKIYNPRHGTSAPEFSEHSLPQVRTDDFESIVLKADRPVLVDFYADWCLPCRQMEPIVVELARENPQWKVVQVNVERDSELAGRYEIEYLPTFLVFKNGDVAARHSGKLDKTAIKELIEH
jgi:thioredoxin 1